MSSLDPSYLNELGKALFGSSVTSDKAAGEVRSYVGTAVSSSSDGTVSVSMPGVVISGDGTQWVDIQTRGAVSVGDTVSLLSADGSPTVSGVIGAGDEAQARIDAAKAQADSAAERADALAESLTDVTATVNGQTVQLTELTSEVSGAVKTADEALTSATSAVQTATSLTDKVEQAYTSADEALTRVSAVEQTASEIKTTVSTDYLSKAEAETSYVTSTETIQTADQILTKISAAQTTATTAKTTADTVSTMVRQYSSGVLVCKTGQSIGALVNANGSFDVVGITWTTGSSPTPSVSSTIMSVDSDSVDFAALGAYLEAYGTSQVSLRASAGAYLRCGATDSDAGVGLTGSSSQTAIIRAASYEIAGKTMTHANLGYLLGKTSQTLSTGCVVTSRGGIVTLNLERTISSSISTWGSLSLGTISNSWMRPASSMPNSEVIGVASATSFDGTAIVRVKSTGVVTVENMSETYVMPSGAWVFCSMSWPANY